MVEELGTDSSQLESCRDSPSLEAARTGLMRVSSVVLLRSTCSINHCCQRSGSEAAGIEIEGRDAVSNGGARFDSYLDKLEKHAVWVSVRACVSVSSNTPLPCSSRFAFEQVARNWGGPAGYVGI